MLQSKGRHASVSAEEAPAVGWPANRMQRSISNQIEEDAVNGLLSDLLSPMVEDRHRASTASKAAAAAAAAATAAAAAAAAPAAPVPAAPVKSDDGNDSDSGVSDSSDSEQETAARDSAFFPDAIGSPRLGRPSQPPFSPKSPPPAVLEPQASTLSWLDYLRQVCPACEELKAERDAAAPGTSVCGPCGERVCASCVLIFKQSGAHAFVRVCRKCRSKVPADGEMICGACCKVPIDANGSETRECTQCKRRTCFGCSKLYVLRSLGEAEPRAVCSACVLQLQLKLSSYPKERAVVAKSSVSHSSSPSLAAAAASPVNSVSPRNSSPPAATERSNSGTFWKSLVSPRRGTDPPPPQTGGSSPGAASSPSGSSPPPRRVLGKQTSQNKILLRRGTASKPNDAPFPGVKLHTAVDSRAQNLREMGEIPESVAHRPVAARAKVTFNEVPVVVGAASSPVPAAVPVAAVAAISPSAGPAAPETGMVLFDFAGDAGAGQIDLKCGRAVRVYERRENGWALGSTGVSEAKGLFPLENVTFDPVLLAAAAAMSGTQEEPTENYRGSVLEMAKFPTGSFVRAMVGGQWTECEVLREGSSRFPYRLRTVDIAKAVIQVDESGIRPTLRRTVSNPDFKGDRLQRRGTEGAKDDSAVPSKATDDADSEILDSLKARVLLMQQQRVHSLTQRPVMTDLSASATSLPAAEFVVEELQMEIGEEVSDVPPASPGPVASPAAAPTASKLGKQLVQAVRDKDVGRVLQALDEGADPDFGGSSAGSPLILAAKLGHIKLALVLLQRGANVNAQTKSGWTALHFAAKDGSKELAELLRSYGARSDIANEWLKTPTDIARDKNDQEVLEILLSKDGRRVPAASSRNSRSALPRTSTAKSEPTSTPRYEGAASVSYVLTFVSSPSTIADSMSPRLQQRVAVDDMILAPARPHAESRGSRPSSLASAAAPVVVPAPAAIVAAPAEPPAPLKSAAEPAWAAVRSQEEAPSSPAATRVIRVGDTVPASPLLNRVPAPKTAPPVRPAVDTAVTQPFRDGPTKSVIMARPKGKQKNPNRKSKSFDLTRSLVDACSLGDLTRIKALLSQGAKVNGVDVATGNTPLIAAVLGGHNGAITLLLDIAGCNVNMPNWAGMTVLHVLAETGNEEAALWLIQRGANVNCKNALGCTPLDLSPKLAEMVATGAYLAQTND